MWIKLKQAAVEGKRGSCGERGRERARYPFLAVFWKRGRNILILVSVPVEVNDSKDTPTRLFPLTHVVAACFADKGKDSKDILGFVSGMGQLPFFTGMDQWVFLCCALNIFP